MPHSAHGQSVCKLCKTEVSSWGLIATGSEAWSGPFVLQSSLILCLREGRVLSSFGTNSYL